MVQSLGWEDPLEKGMDTHSSILAWRIPWREEPGRIQFMGSQRVGHNWGTNTTPFAMKSSMILAFFWMLSFKPAFSLSSFTFIKRLFCSSSLSAIRVVSSAYLKLLIFLLAILILAHNSSSLAFCTMYSAYKLNKQGDNILPWHTPFPNLNQSIVPCLVLAVASLPTYRFLKRQIRCLVFPSL